jgi:hypothetical protein
VGLFSLSISGVIAGFTLKIRSNAELLSSSKTLIFISLILLALVNIWPV